MKFLVVVDMQNDFITGALGSAEALALLPRVAARMRDFDGTVVLTQDTHGEGYMASREGRKLPVPHCIRGTEGWRLAPEIEAFAEKNGCRIFQKPAFGSVELGEYFAGVAAEDPGPLSIELAGLCTDICVISNAMLLKAFAPEAEIRVNAACCAGVTPESHKTALVAMGACQIEVL